MVTALIVSFLVAHGLVHLAVWAAPPPAREGDAPFDPSHSWTLTAVGVRAPTAHSIAVALAGCVALAYVVAGIGVATGSTWWAGWAALAATLGLVLKLAYFNAWLLIGIALDCAVIAAVVMDWPAALP